MLAKRSEPRSLDLGRAEFSQHVRPKKTCTYRRVSDSSGNFPVAKLQLRMRHRKHSPTQAICTTSRAKRGEYQTPQTMPTTIRTCYRPLGDGRRQTDTSVEQTMPARYRPLGGSRRQTDTSVERREDGDDDSRRTKTCLRSEASLEVLLCLLSLFLLE